MADSRKTTIQYRRLTRDVSGLGSLTLKEALARALRQTCDGAILGERASLRIADLDQDGRSTLVNKLTAGDLRGPALEGQLLRFAPGQDVPAILDDLASETNEYDIERYRLEEGSPVEGILYFAVIGDHVGVIESHAVRTSWLERYFTWLLKERTQVVTAKGARIILEAQIHIAGGRGLKEVTELDIRPRPSYSATEGDEVETTVNREAAEGRRGGESVLELLTHFGWSAEAIDSLRKQIPPDGRLEGLLKVFIKQKRSRKPIGVASLNQALRDVEPSDIALVGPDGKQVGDLRKLKEIATVRTQGTLLDPQDAMRQIVNMLIQWGQDSKIDLVI